MNQSTLNTNGNMEQTISIINDQAITATKMVQDSDGENDADGINLDYAIGYQSAIFTIMVLLEEKGLAQEDEKNGLPAYSREWGINCWIKLLKSL
jgi:hypothetical protein